MAIGKELVNALKHMSDTLSGIAAYEKKTEIDCCVTALTESYQKLIIAEDIIKDRNKEIANQIQQVKEKVATLVERVNDL